MQSRLWESDRGTTPGTKFFTNSFPAGPNTYFAKKNINNYRSARIENKRHYAL